MGARGRHHPDPHAPQHARRAGGPAGAVTQAMPRAPNRHAQHDRPIHEAMMASLGRFTTSQQVDLRLRPCAIAFHTVGSPPRRTAYWVPGQRANEPS